MTGQQYTDFIKGALNIGFIDDQVDFLWDWMCIIAGKDPQPIDQRPNPIEDIGLKAKHPLQPHKEGTDI